MSPERSFSPELQFRRDENKFFIPSPKDTVPFVDSVRQICSNLGYLPEEHPHPFTRSVYFNPENSTLVPGVSFRFRQYVDFDLRSPNKGEVGFYEAKWFKWDPELGRQIKHKIRFQGPYKPEITIGEILERNKNESIELPPELMTLLNEKLHPLLLISYQRDRYRHPKTGNVVSLDRNLRYFYLENGEFIPIGETDGFVVEYKERADDPHMRWQLYRLLVTVNAVRFYGKKGEGFNLLQRFKSETAPLLRSEIPGYEVEAKLEVVEKNPWRANSLFDYLYRHFLYALHQDYFINPLFTIVGSQSTITTYLIDPQNPDIEGKILVGLEAKLSQKRLILDEKGVLVREEEKGSRFRYDRKQVRRISKENGFLRIGKTQRIRRAFYIRSPEGRVFKISMDFNWPLPQKIGERFFCQIEIEYTGKYADMFTTTIPFHNEEFHRIIAQVREIKEIIINLATAEGFKVIQGRRKVDMLRS